MKPPYSPAIEIQIKKLYCRLPEKNRRLYAGVEALKLPYGGVSYISRILDCSRDTVIRGIKELDEDEKLADMKSRTGGGGRTPVLEKEVNKAINDVFLAILKEHTAGDPMDEKVKWTDLTRIEISVLLAKKGFKVSRNIVRKLLKNNGYVKRKSVKKSLLANNI